MEGAQSLHTNLYEEVVGLPTLKLARVARNTQLILREETGMTEVGDLWGGSYMMDILKYDLYYISTDILREVE